MDRDASQEMWRKQALEYVNVLDKSADDAVLLVAATSSIDDDGKAWLLNELKSRPAEILELQPGSPSVRRRREPWYPGPPARGHWQRLRDRLVEKGWGGALPSIDESSSKVVGLLEKPSHQARFRCKGLVVGFVQSGKTANMTAVIAKAVDAGYNFVIALSGPTNALRAQTQMRFEDDLGARDSGHWHCWTQQDSDEEQGDFASKVGFAKAHKGQCQLMVIKKNTHVLQRVLEAVEKTPLAIRKGFRVLLLDDECDQASVNAARYQADMTRINELVREVLGVFDAVSYVGYTATPFANILINPYVKHAGRGGKVLDDLYPSDFITCLPRPSAYFGAETVFGRAGIDGHEEEEGLDMVRLIPDDEEGSYRPATRADKDSFELEVSGSLEVALRYHVLATAARAVREGALKPVGMLVHTTAYVNPHRAIQEGIEAWFREQSRRWDRGDPELRTALKRLWVGEEGRLDSSESELVWPTFESLEPEIASLLSRSDAHRIHVVVENGCSDQRLDFDSMPRYVVVGGNVLARGLTLEGLTTTFFTRSANQYDTLMQMGRWFGYRNGYQDLPRAWMGRDLEIAFRDLATVEAEIRAEIEVNEARGLTPKDVAVRVRQLPGMAITARSKMSAAEPCNISLSEQHRQTFRFEVEDADWLEGNLEAARVLVERLRSDAGLLPTEGLPRSGAGAVYEQVPWSTVREFVETYSVHEDHGDIATETIVEYVSAEQKADGHACSVWSVIFIGPSNGADASDLIGGLTKTTRSRLKTPAGRVADIKSLMSRADLLADVPADAGGSKSWEENMQKREGWLRERGKAVTPQLFVYVVDGGSRPREGSKTRVPLGAVRDVLAVGYSFPKSVRPVGEAYVRVKLRAPEVDGEELDDEDLGALIEEPEAGDPQGMA